MPCTLQAKVTPPGHRLQLTCRYRSKWLVVLEFNRAVKTCLKEICSSFSSARRHSAGCCSVQLMQVYATLSGKLESISYISSGDKRRQDSHLKCFTEGCREKSLPCTYSLPDTFHAMKACCTANWGTLPLRKILRVQDVIDISTVLYRHFSGRSQQVSVLK